VVRKQFAYKLNSTTSQGYKVHEIVAYVNMNGQYVCSVTFSKGLKVKHRNATSIPADLKI
jgi:hypothetical protein